MINGFFWEKYHGSVSVERIGYNSQGNEETNDANVVQYKYIVTLLKRINGQSYSLAAATNK